MSQKNADSSENDVWDDSLLIQSYDKSVKLAKKALAKKIAQATNTIKNKKTESSTSTDTEDHTKEEPGTKNYEVGDYVRATYDDGVDYEARIIAVDKSRQELRLKYIGYENEQNVKMADVIPSWGKKVRRKQFKDAKSGNAMEQEENHREADTVSYQQPEMFGRLPPPPPMPPHLSGEDSEHLSAMLMSWYMSGYYTGFYHGQKAQKTPKRK